MRISYTSSEIGPTIPLPIIAELIKKRATHATFHANRLISLDLYYAPGQHHSKNKDEQFIGKEGCLEHLSDLDLSSNSLHEGYAPPYFSAPKVSLLEIAHRLRKLNLSSNRLTAKSFYGLITNKSRDETAVFRHLHFLDISHNNLSRLPKGMHTIFPALKHLIATNNKIKSLSSLVQQLHTFRGTIESIEFMNASQRNLSEANARRSDNPVCSSNLYREKIVFVLGCKLQKIDCTIISAREREEIRIVLERGLSNLESDPQHNFDELLNGENENLSRVCENYSRNSQQHSQNKRITLSPRSTKHSVSRSKHHKKEHNMAEEEISDDDLLLHRKTESSSEKKINHLEDQVAFLSNLVEKQAHITSHILDIANEYDDDSDSDVLVEKEENRQNQSIECNADLMANPLTQKGSCPEKKKVSAKPQHNPNEDIHHPQMICIAVLKFTINRIEEKGKRENLRLAFSRWNALTQLIRCKLESEIRLKKSEHHWKSEAKEMIDKAVCDEAGSSMRKIGLAEEANRLANERILCLTNEVIHLKKQLQCEMDNRRTNEEISKEATIVSKCKAQQLEEKLRIKDEEHDERVRQANAELERIRNGLRSTTEALERERSERTHLESLSCQMQLANQEAENTATAQAAKLQNLKLQSSQKDVSVLC